MKQANDGSAGADSDAVAAGDAAWQQVCWIASLAQGDASQAKQPGDMPLLPTTPSTPSLRWDLRRVYNFEFYRVIAQLPSTYSLCALDIVFDIHTLPDVPADVLAWAVDACRDLRALTLSCDTRFDWRPVLATLQLPVWRRRSLASLGLTFDAACARRIAAALATLQHSLLPQLLCLRLTLMGQHDGDDTGDDSDFLASVSPRLHPAVMLRDLDLDIASACCEQAASGVAAALACMPQLCCLRLRACCTMLHAFLDKPVPSLETIVLCHSCVRRHRVGSVRFLHLVPRLTTLQLPYEEYPDDVTVSLAADLRRAPHLRDLALGCVDTGAGDLAKALQALPSLERLSYTPRRSRVARQVFIDTALPVLCNLTGHLSINADGTAIDRLPAALAAMAQLASLDIELNNVYSISSDVVADLDRLVRHGLADKALLTDLVLRTEGIGSLADATICAGLAAVLASGGIPRLRRLHLETVTSVTTQLADLLVQLHVRGCAALEHVEFPNLHSNDAILPALVRHRRYALGVPGIRDPTRYQCSSSDEVQELVHERPTWRLATLFERAASVVLRRWLIDPASLVHGAGQLPRELEPTYLLLHRLVACSRCGEFTDHPRIDMIHREPGAGQYTIASAWCCACTHRPPARTE